MSEVATQPVSTFSVTFAEAALDESRGPVPWRSGLAPTTTNFG